MSFDASDDDRLKAIDTYLRKVDARDPTVLDVFTDDVQMFFPKFGLAHGKAALAKLSETLTGELASIEHDIDGFHYIVSGNFVVVEGTERGVTRNGVYWPDGVVSEGRFCNVFEFDGVLIQRRHIYVDPDYTSADQDRIRMLRGETTGDATRNTVRRYFELLRSGAELESLASLFSEDVDFAIAGNVELVSWIGRRQGRTGVADFFRDLREQVESLRFEVRSMVVEGDKAVALGELETRVRRTGKIIESEFAFEFTIKDAPVVRYRLFEDSFSVAQAVIEN